MTQGGRELTSSFAFRHPPAASLPFVVRRPLVLPLVPFFLASACVLSDTGASAPSASGSGGPDAILVRMPRDGDFSRAYRWGSDSAIWTSGVRIPAINQVLGFDDQRGSIAFVDARGVPGRVDLRMGSVIVAATTALTAVTSADGWAIYGLTPKGEVSRLTPSGTWSITTSPAPRALLPQADGSLVLLSDSGDRSQLRRLRPTEPRITDTASVPKAQLAIHTDVGDRIYFTGDSGLLGVRVRDLARTGTVRLSASAVDAVATPSGDRIFIALTGKNFLVVYDRFAELIERTIDMPGEASALRMDPDGQFVLVHSAGGDSVRIVAVGTARVIGSVRSQWRSDLPLVGPDGSLALALDDDVVIVDAETQKERTRFLGGAKDAWALIRWNGFRPRAAWLDSPVTFAEDSAGAAGEDPAAMDSALAATPPAGAAPAPVPARPPVVSAQPRLGIFTLSFAAMLSEERAKTLAATIRVDGRPAQVVPGTRDGSSIYRIVFGPFDTKEGAERAGQRTGLPYWVYEGAP